MIFDGLGSSSLGMGCGGGSGGESTWTLARVTADPAGFWAAHWYHPAWASVALCTVRMETPEAASVEMSASCITLPSYVF